MFEIRPRLKPILPLVIFLLVGTALGVAWALKGEIETVRDWATVIALPIVPVCAIFLFLVYLNSRFAVGEGVVRQTNALNRSTVTELSSVGRIIFAHHVSNGIAKPATYLILLKLDGQLLFRLVTPMFAVADVTAFLNATGRVAEVIEQPISVSQLRSLYPAAATWSESRPWFIPGLVIALVAGIPLLGALVFIVILAMAR